MRQREKADHDDRTDDEQRYVFGDAPREAARFFDAPQEVEAVLHLLDGAQQGPEQQRESQWAEQARADAVGDFHDLLRELTGPIAHGFEELVDDRLQFEMAAEVLEHDECKRK